jgi:hypothetical protein
VIGCRCLYGVGGRTVEYFRDGGEIVAMRLSCKIGEGRLPLLGWR